MISSLLLTLKYFAPISSVAIVGFELVNVCWVYSENYFLVWKFCGKAQFPHRNCETMRKLLFTKFLDQEIVFTILSKHALFQNLVIIFCCTNWIRDIWIISNPVLLSTL